MITQIIELLYVFIHPGKKFHNETFVNRSSQRGRIMNVTFDLGVLQPVIIIESRLPVSILVQTRLIQNDRRNNLVPVKNITAPNNTHSQILSILQTLPYQKSNRFISSQERSTTAGPIIHSSWTTTHQIDMHWMQATVVNLAWENKCPPPLTPPPSTTVFFPTKNSMYVHYGWPVHSNIYSKAWQKKELKVTTYRWASRSWNIDSQLILTHSRAV